MKERKKRIISDGLVILLSVAIAILLVKSPYLGILIRSVDGYYLLAAFVAGIFFTSAFTTAPAIAVLAKLGLAYNPFLIALVGALGSLIGDLIIFSFVKSHIREDVDFLLSLGKSKRAKHILKRRFVRWSLAFFGALVIASPLPDELGLALMGLSDIKTSRFSLISYVFNAIGILAIALIARSI